MASAGRIELGARVLVLALVLACLDAPWVAALARAESGSATPSATPSPSPSPSTTPTATYYARIGDAQGGFPSGVLDALDYFGEAVGRAGDLDGDGVEDLIVGAKYDDQVELNAGTAYALLMSGPTTVKSAQRVTDMAGFVSTVWLTDNCGSAVDGVGDVDNDGVPDLAMGCPRDDDAAYDAGAVYVMLMGSAKSNRNKRAGQKAVDVKATVKIAGGQSGFS